MVDGPDVQQLVDELVDAFKWGEESRIRELLSQPGETQQVRDVLERMLEDSYGLARQAAVFGLAELGGPASVERLERQLAIEQKRGDYDSEAVVEEIVRVLGRLDEPGARAILLRVLELVCAGELEHLNTYFLARSLWRRRHPTLLPAVRRNLEQLLSSAPKGLRGLCVLLERTAEELGTWACDPAVPLEIKTEMLVVLEEEVPETLEPVLPAFISAAQALSEQAASQEGTAARYCERLLRLLMYHRERLLGTLPRAAGSELRALALRLVAAPSVNCSSQAVLMLEFVGRPEDAAVIAAHRPAHPNLAGDFDRVAQVLRSRLEH